MIHDSHNGNISATRNQLRYWSLVSTVMPQFQHVPKIQHRSWAGRAKLRRRGRIAEAHYAGWREEFGNGSGIEKRPEGYRGLRGFEAMPVNSEFPNLGFKRLSRYT